MTVTTSTEQALMESGGDYIARGLAVAPRAIYGQGVVTAISNDSSSNGMYQLTVGSVSGSDFADVESGMTCDIGTTAGDRDVGMVRIRRSGSSTTLLIAETAPSEVPIQVGHYVTVRYEWLPWRIAKRIVPTLDGSGNITAITEYLDYDLTYPGGSIAFPPKPNLVAGMNADGSPRMVRPFGWLDSGQTYRTVTLNASLFSVILNPGAAYESALWAVGDGTIVTGTTTSDTIVVTFPKGFRYIYLVVYDTNGASAWLYFPIWADDPANPSYVLRNFAVTSDEQDADRQMQIEFFGNADDASATLLPERSLVCYFEEPTWAEDRSADPPEAYVDQVMGWVTDDDPLLKLQASTYGIKIGGAATWMQKFKTTSITISNTGSTPTTYTEMEHMTVDRVFDFSLRAYSTLRSLVNVFYSGVAVEADMMTLPLGDAWSTLGAVDASAGIAAAALMSAVACDSFSHIWMQRHYDYLNSSTRSARQTALALTSADWKDDDGFSLPTSKTNATGVVNANGDVWNGGNRLLYGSIAPGKRDAYGTQTAKLPDQFLSYPTPQSDLNILNGFHFWRVNNNRPDEPLKLFGNLDTVELAWNQPISITWTSPSIRGTVLNQALFLVKHISRTHGAAAADEPKQITLTLEQVTDGGPGETLPMLQNNGVTSLTDLNGDLIKTVDKVAAFTSNGHVFTTTNFQTTPPTWTDHDLSGTLGSTVVMFIADAYSPRYLEISAQVNGWIVTLTKIFRIVDVFGARTLTLLKTLSGSDSFGAFGIWTERVQQNFVAALYEHVASPNEVHALVSTDGATFPTDTLVDTVAVLNGTLAMSAHTPGRLFMTMVNNSSTQEALQSLDSGVHFSGLAVPAIASPGQMLHIPYADASERTAYYGNVFTTKKVVGTVVTDVSPVVTGNTIGPVKGQFAIHTADLIADHVLLCGQHTDTSTLNPLCFSDDGAQAWTILDTLSGGSNTYLGCSFAWDDPWTIFVWGKNVLKFSTDPYGAGLVDKTGSISGTILNICGSW